MLYVVIGLILAIILVIGYGAWMRKKSYSAIDHAEERRMELINRPVAQELAKIKKLKMAGDTEKNFEKWRSEWDKIVAAELPSIEKDLFKCEELTDKYHFKKAARRIKELHERMDEIGGQIDQIIVELNRVVDSERQNRDDIQTVKENYHTVKKTMLTQRNQFHETLPRLDQEVKAIDEAYKKFGSETENGNYIEARNCLLQVKKDLAIVIKQLSRIPTLYQDAKKSIPELMRELQKGKEEMEEKGYSLKYLQIDTQIEENEKHLQTILDSVARMELDEASEALTNIHEQMDFLFAQMEKEVLSRQELHQIAPEVEGNLERVGNQVKTLTDETETVKNSYHLDVTDLKTQLSIQKAFDKIQKDYSALDEIMKNSSQPFSTITDNLKKIREDMEHIESESKAFEAKIKALRKDELAARDTVHQMKHTLFEVRQLIQQSNLLGVPSAFAEALELAGRTLNEVNEKLDEMPLNMTEVRQTLTTAQNAVGGIHQTAAKLIETAEFAEEMIRYGNRYRTDSQEINKELNEAERLFRDFDYDAAAETAVRAIERKEPKILKRVNLYDEAKSQA